MRIEPKQAFYNEDTGAVQPWKDIEVTDTVGNALVAEGLVTEIEGGGGGGGDFTTAQATIYNTGDSGISVFVAAISEGKLITNINIDGGDNVTVTTVLYKGTQAVWCASSDVIEVTGDAEIDDGMAIVSGDCTIKFE